MNETPVREGAAIPNVGRVAPGRKTLVLLIVAVVSALAVVGVAFVKCAPSSVTGMYMSDHVHGMEQTDEQMVEYFSQHRAEFAGLLDEYGLPDQGTGGQSHLEEEGQDLGGVGILSASWSEYRYGANLAGQAEQPQQPRALWLTSWEETGRYHSESKGYVYTRDRLTPVLDELRADNPYAWTAGRGDRGTSFVDLGDGWYLFYAWRWD